MFKEVNNGTQISETKVSRKIRDDFHKKIRKEVIENKIAQMRRNFLVNRKSEEQSLNYFQQQKDRKQEQNYLVNQFHQRHKNQSKQSNYIEASQNIKTIQRSLSIISKFKNIRLQSLGSGEIQKFSKKIDAIICLAMSINQWILEDQMMAEIEKEIKDQEIIQIQQNSQKTQNIQQIKKDSQIFDNLKPIKWTQNKNHRSRLQLLEQITNLVLIEKIEVFIELLESRYEEAYQISGSLLISLNLLKWVYFYQNNLKIFYLSSSSQTKFNLEIDQCNSYWEIFSNSYFEIAFKVIKFLPLNYMVEIFFNSILNVSYFKENSIPNNLKQIHNCFILSSPFQYLIEDQGEGQRLLRQLQSRMELKIYQKEKWLCKQRMRNMSLQGKQVINMDRIEKEQVLIQKAKKILQTLSERLQIKRKGKQKNYYFS